MSEFKIPKRFKLFGRTFTVEYDEQLDRIKKCMGEALFEEHKIFLQPTTETNGRKKEAVEEVFMHGLLHMCFSIMGKEEISANEVIITTLAGLLHQALTTAEYDDVVCDADVQAVGSYDYGGTAAEKPVLYSGVE